MERKGLYQDIQRKEEGLFQNIEEQCEKISGNIGVLKAENRILLE